MKFYLQKEWPYLHLKSLLTISHPWSSTYEIIYSALTKKQVEFQEYGTRCRHGHCTAYFHAKHSQRSTVRCIFPCQWLFSWHYRVLFMPGTEEILFINTVHCMFSWTLCMQGPGLVSPILPMHRIRLDCPLWLVKLLNNFWESSRTGWQLWILRYAMTNCDQR